MIKPLRSAGTLLAAALVLGACRDDIDVAITAVGDTVEFAVADSTPPCIDRVTVYAAADRGRPVWAIDATERARCVARFQYGTVPSGFEQHGATENLVPGTLYLVSIGRARG